MLAKVQAAGLPDGHASYFAFEAHQQWNGGDVLIRIQSAIASAHFLRGD